MAPSLAYRKRSFLPRKKASSIRFISKAAAVVTADGESLGTVTDVLDSGGTYILKVDGKDGEILIPFAQSFLRKVDLGAAPN